VNFELAGTWKEEVAVYFKVPAQYFFREIEERFIRIFCLTSENRTQSTKENCFLIAEMIYLIEDESKMATVKWCTSQNFRENVDSFLFSLGGICLCVTKMVNL
jgi:hypothetical protein